MLQQSGLLCDELVATEHVASYLKTIEAGYRDSNPYHNRQGQHAPHIHLQPPLLDPAAEHSSAIMNSPALPQLGRLGACLLP